MFIVDLAIFLVGSAAQFFVADAWQLFVIRLVMGMAIGADYAIGWPLLVEVLAGQARGKLMAFQEVAWYVGYLLSYAVGYYMSTSIHADWRDHPGHEHRPVAYVFLLRLGSPESPRWLLSKGRREEAFAIANQFMEDADVKEMEHEKPEKPNFGKLFSPQYRKLHDLRLHVLGLQRHPLLRHRHLRAHRSGKPGGEDGLAGALVLNGVVVAGSLAAMFLIEKVGRRKLSIPPMWIAAVALVVIGLFSHMSPIIILISFIVFSFFNAISTALTSSTPARFFRRIRGAGVGLATAFSPIATAAGHSPSAVRRWPGRRNHDADRRKHLRPGCGDLPVPCAGNQG